MRSQQLTATDTGRPTALPMVPGVVDGLITAVTDTDGSVCLQIRVKLPGAGHTGGNRIEVILDPEHKEILGRVLQSANRPVTAPLHSFPPVRCSVGVGTWTRPDD